MNHEIGQPSNQKEHKNIALKDCGYLASRWLPNLNASLFGHAFHI